MSAIGGVAAPASIEPAVMPLTSSHLAKGSNDIDSQASNTVAATKPAQPEYPTVSSFPYKCYCGHNFEENTRYLEHLRLGECVPWEKIRQYCDSSRMICLCKTEFVSRGSLIRHLRTRVCRTLWPEEDESRLYVCGCGKRFGRADGIRRHQRSSRCQETRARLGIEQESCSSRPNLFSGRLRPNRARVNPELLEDIGVRRDRLAKRSSAAKATKDRGLKPGSPKGTRGSNDSKDSKDSIDSKDSKDSKDLKISKDFKISKISKLPKIYPKQPLKRPSHPQPLPPINQVLVPNWPCHGMGIPQNGCMQSFQVWGHPQSLVQMPSLVYPSQSILLPVCLLPIAAVKARPLAQVPSTYTSVPDQTQRTPLNGLSKLPDQPAQWCSHPPATHTQPARGTPRQGSHPPAPHVQNTSHALKTSPGPAHVAAGTVKVRALAALEYSFSAVFAGYDQGQLARPLRDALEQEMRSVGTKSDDKDMGARLCEFARTFTSARIQVKNTRALGAVLRKVEAVMARHLPELLKELST